MPLKDNLNSRRATDVAVMSLVLGSCFLFASAIVGVNNLGTSWILGLAATGGTFWAVSCISICLSYYFTTSPPLSQPTTRATLAPLANRTLSNRHDPSPPPVCELSPDSERRYFNLISIDVCALICDNLPSQERLNLMTVSTAFRKAAISNKFWINFGYQNGYRFWGSKEKYFAIQNSVHQMLQKPHGFFFHEIRIYHDLLRSGMRKGGFLEYIARLMPGGPTEFKAILEINDIPDATQLQPDDMGGATACAWL